MDRSNGVRFGLVGAGGYGREVMPLLREIANRQPGSQVYFVAEGDQKLEAINGVELISLDTFSALPGMGYFNVAIGDSIARERIATQCMQAGLKPVSIFAPNVIVLDGNEIGEGAVFSPFSMVTSNARIGKFFHANIYAYVAHDCVVGDYVTFAPGAKCNGNVVIENHAYIGTGAVLKQGSSSKPLVIGEGAVIGMGAVVTKNVAPGAVVVGNPAREMQR
ncbi:acetyltransferase [Variovorax guangxiensis]|uniref:Acetyltransferase n=1 Tax=Variovorax guangxiensis TaxID=1775474 RepID=A0A502DTZ3_9BURK|nr:acetyltransferase [Variovorax guangxiensis]TPG24547.1 acetyltransferase [Variovorax ginsengisoli]TPG28797.1 acetyltransferase [Variovorax guangxiensis]